jgi:hypothetical protein
MTNTPENNPSTLTSEELLIAGFKRLSTAKKLELIWDFVYELNEDFNKLNDPVLSREMDFLDGVLSNVDTRIEEIEKIYGLNPE